MPGITAMESLQFSDDSLTLLLIVMTLNLEKIVYRSIYLMIFTAMNKHLFLQMSSCVGIIQNFVTP